MFWIVDGFSGHDFMICMAIYIMILACIGYLLYGEKGILHYHSLFLGFHEQAWRLA